MIKIPAAIAAAIEAELAAVPAPLWKQIEALAELFELFTRARSRLKRSSYLDSPRYRSAYLRYHLPLNTARALCVLEHALRLSPRLGELEEVVDLGAGPGSASLAALHLLPPERARTYSLFDRSRGILKVARRLLEASARGRGPGGSERSASLKSLVTAVAPLPALPRLPRRALVWLSMVLNELGAASARGSQAAAIIEALAQRLDPPSVVVIIEPALRLPGRDLLRLHDAALGGPWRVLAPCTHELPCPLLREAGKSWCHFHFHWDAPRFVRAVADPLRLDHEHPALAFLILERSAAPAPARPDRARVIGDPMRVRGGKEGLYLCQEGERRLLTPPPPGAKRGDILLAEEKGKASVEVAWVEPERGRARP